MIIGTSWYWYTFCRLWGDCHCLSVIHILRCARDKGAQFRGNRSENLVKGLDNLICAIYIYDCLDIARYNYKVILVLRCLEIPYLLFIKKCKYNVKAISV